MAKPAPSIRRQHLLAGGAIFAICVGIASPNLAQNSALAPTFGTLSGGAGFGSLSQTIQAGGDIEANVVASTCNGFIADAPDVIFEYSGSASVLIQGTSDADTTIVVEAPNGQILCNDDFDDLNPGVETAAGISGRYAIWIGTYLPIENNTYPDADILLTEQPGAAPPAAPTPGGVTGTGVNAGLQPTFAEISVTGGFGSQTFDLQAGGLARAADVDVSCAGFIADTPDYTLNVQPGLSAPIDVAIRSDVDTTLVVVTPSGDVVCNDDAVDLNPGLTIANPAGGIYALWVGTYSPIENDFYPDAVMTVSTSAGGSSLAPPPGNPRFALPPSFGSTQLNAGFGRHELTIQAGGFVNGADFGASCTGFVADAPDYVVSYAGDLALRVTATSEADTTIAVGLPNGDIICNDDFEGLNPGVIGPEGLRGSFPIWVGTYSPIENDFYPDARLVVEEVSTFKGQPSGAITSMSLTAGFTPDPFVTSLAAGGMVDASTFGDNCWGFVASRPDFVLAYTSGDFPLRFFVNSDADTTMLVRTPRGEVICNDDTDGLNPAVTIPDPVSGPYEVYIGTFSGSEGFPEATLAITEILDEKSLPDGAITQTTVSLGMTRSDFDLLAGGSLDAFNNFGGNCNGFVAANPDFTAFVDSAGIDVEFTVRSAEDTTLAVRTPSGQFLCDDDSAGDFNPLVIADGAQSGAYEVWLGTFSSVGHAPATLSIRDLSAGTTPPNVPGEGKK